MCDIIIALAWYAVGWWLFFNLVLFVWFIAIGIFGKE